MAVGKATGDFIALLNNDVRVIEPGWLTIMMGYALQPHIGAVGPKLLYPDDRIQHAGIILLDNVAIAAESFKGRPRDTNEYFALAQVARWVIAVTGACLVTSKAKFQEVGGLDEQHLPVAFNDVDLCLKLYKAGYKNVYTPHTALYHFEFTSRGKDYDQASIHRAQSEANYMRDTWKILASDPFYSPHFSRSESTYLLLSPMEEPYLDESESWRPFA